MDSAYISALSALAGSAIGALASFGTTWLTQHHQDRAQRLSQESTRRETIYGEFIEQASKLFADALVHTLEDPSKMSDLYSMLNKLRLFASEETIRCADAVLHRIVETYYKPNEDFHNRRVVDSNSLDLLRDFTRSCRADLNG